MKQNKLDTIAKDVLGTARTQLIETEELWKHGRITNQEWIKRQSNIYQIAKEDLFNRGLLCHTLPFTIAAEGAETIYDYDILP